MGPIGFSIVGCGHIGARYAGHIATRARLVAAGDVDDKALQRFSSLFPGVKCYHSIEELLEHDTVSEVTIVCTPNGYHAPHSILAFEHGKHVICEKPMALASGDAHRMIRAAQAVERHLFVVAQNRFNPAVQEVKRLLDRGSLGRICSAEINCFWNRGLRYYQESPWRGTRCLDGGILYTQFSHFIDLVYWLLGDVHSVATFSRNQNHADTIEFEDTLVAILDLKSGALATLNCTINSHGKSIEGSIAIFGTTGTVKIGGQYLNVLEYQDIERHEPREAPPNPGVKDFGHYQGATSNHDKVIENVIDVLAHGAGMVVSANDGLKTVEIIEKVYAAARR